jgi:excinuclease ABC subunit B
LDFKVVSKYAPAGDQKQAIDKLAEGIKNGLKYQTLKGVTASGKTFSMAKIIEAVQAPALVISHNKTLAAQLYREFKDFFPDNAVEYFVSYYDYYQPEAYVAGKDLYIAKDASINEEIDRLRLKASMSLMERRDVLVVATVSCIYGIGNPADFKQMRAEITKNSDINLTSLIKKLINLQYNRNDAVLERSKFRVKGDTVDIFPSYADYAVRIQFEWDEIDKICKIDPLTGGTTHELDYYPLYPAKYFVMPEERIKNAKGDIRNELEERYNELHEQGKALEAERLRSRTEYDLEMLNTVGYCSGIENYSRHLSGRKKGERPAVLIDFFPDNFVCFIDESHVTLPQIGGMYEGDRSRKQSLVQHGFRLPSALDNRPLVFNEFESILNQTIYVSATPGNKELECSNSVVEQIIRPTGLVDPEVEVRQSEGQIEDLYSEIQERIKAGERTLITTLTKKMAEDLSDYFMELGLKVNYLHSEINTFERVEILKSFRQGDYDVIVGINLLREGLDLPEVSLIAILDADKVGFLRSSTSLIQIIGRAARNVNGKVIMYADRMSGAMEEAISETNRRRKLQLEYNKKHGITPKTISKSIQDILVRKKEEKQALENQNIEIIKKRYNILIPKQKNMLIKELEKEMLELAKNLEFERAAVIRDEILKLKGEK